MGKSAEKMNPWSEYDYVVVNHDVVASVAQVQAIVTPERLRRNRQLGLADFTDRLRDRVIAAGRLRKIGSRNRRKSARAGQTQPSRVAGAQPPRPPPEVKCRPERGRVGHVAIALLIASFATFPVPAHAFVAAGDRVFPGTLILPQIAPTDEAYIQGATLFSGTQVPLNTRRTDAIGFFGKTITEDLGIRVKGVYTRLDPTVGSSRYGWQTLTANAQYEAVLDGPHEFLLSVGVDRQFGGTGAERVQRRGFSGVGATAPTIYFGKGLGDLDIGYLRPLAIAGTFGYLISDKSPRPDVATTGFAIEYSIPYLQSKVRALDLPDLIRGLTPITELFLTTPAGQAHGTPNTALIAPGLIYTGEGWQFGIEAMIPMTRATGRGLGVTAQFHVWLDYLFPIVF
jgi:hypothetical protein